MSSQTNCWQNKYIPIDRNGGRFTLRPPFDRFSLARPYLTTGALDLLCRKKEPEKLAHVWVSWRDFWVGAQKTLVFAGFARPLWDGAAAVSNAADRENPEKLLGSSWISNGANGYTVEFPVRIWESVIFNLSLPSDPHFANPSSHPSLHLSQAL
jgi:hypothetical protein